MRLSVFCVDQDSLNQVGDLVSGQKLVGCFECRTYHIQVPDSAARLYADDALLLMEGDVWVWSPGFYAGEVEFELELEGSQHPSRFVVDVSPSVDKSGRDQYIDYLEEIVEYAPRLVMGTEPSHHGLGGRSRERGLWIRYARLKQFIDRYLVGLQGVVDRPISQQFNYREQVPIPMAKKVDAGTLQQLVSSPRLLSAMAGLEVASDYGPLHDKRLNVPHYEFTYDNPANRLICRQLYAVRHLVRGLFEEFALYKGTVSHTETDIFPRLARKQAYLQDIDKRLRRVLRQEPFVSADITKSGATELNSVSGHPHYSLAHRMGIRILRQGLSDLSDSEHHSLAPTWQIYEAWCFVTIAKEFQNRFSDWDWQLEDNPIAADMRLTGSCGQEKLSVYSQLVCGSLLSTNRYGFCSISRERRPDLVVELEREGERRYICLDSKYSVNRSRVLDAMASAHIYHDSLRCDGISPLLSLILVPNNRDLPLLESSDYWHENKVGCFSLANYGDVKLLADLLLEWFKKH